MAPRAARCATPGSALLGAGGETECAGELVGDIGIADRTRGWSGDDQHVARWNQFGAAATEELADQAADVVARRGATDLATGGDAEARRRGLSLSGDHDEMGQRLAPPLTLQRDELVALAQPECSRKPL